MKKLIFVSVGRCGTKRLTEILQDKSKDISVTHQMPISRAANIIGNILYLTGAGGVIKKKIYTHIIRTHSKGKNFICTDPLTAMMIPENLIKDDNIMIVHIIRSKKPFAKSFFKISRTRFKSFIAHNIIPFWQIGIFPLENSLNKKILLKYEQLCDRKNQYFTETYSRNPHYIQISMNELFSTSCIERIVNNFFDENIHISKEELSIRSN